MSFVATEQEKVFTRSIFAKAGTREFRYITRDHADGVFAGFGLQPATLDKIWQIADTDNNKFLTERELEIAIRLIGWAKCSREPDQELLTQVPPLPAFMVISTQGTSPNPGRLPSYPYAPVPVNSTGLQITPDQCQKFLNTFYQSGAINGLLSGEKAHSCFSKSNLPPEILGRIWHLADTHKRNFLDATDFIIGMFLIESVVFNRLQSIPPNLPLELYEQARNGVSSLLHGPCPQGQQTRSNVSSYSHIKTASSSTDYTGAFLTSQPSLSLETTTDLQSPTTPRPSKIPGFDLSNRSKWNISAEEKVKYDSVFTQLDSQRRGSIDGRVAAEYMRLSRLPDSTLSRIWDQVDLNRDGALAPDEFALAMHLMHRVLDGNETLADSPKPFVPLELDTNPDRYSPPTQDVPAADRLLRMPTPVVNQITQPATFTQRSHKADVAAQVSDITKIQNQVAAARDAVDSITTGRSVFATSNEATTSELARLRKQLAELEEQRVSEEAQLATVRAHKEQLDDDLSNARRDLLRLQNEVEATRQKRNQLENELKDVEGQVHKVSEELEAKQLEAGCVKGEKESFERLVDTAKARLATAEKNAVVPYADISPIERIGDDQLVDDTTGGQPTGITPTPALETGLFGCLSSHTFDAEESRLQDKHPGHLIAVVPSKPASRYPKLSLFLICLVVCVFVTLGYYAWVCRNTPSIYISM